MAGAGEVFAGRSADGRVVAVTVVPPEVAAAPGFRERFRARAETARTVSGEAVMPLVDVDPDAPSPWSATAFVQGLSLRRSVERYGGLPEPSLRRLAAGLAGAMARIHAAGLTHGDVGPDAVLLTVGGPYVSVFGTTGITEDAASPMDDMFGLGSTVLFAASGSEPRWEGASEDVRTRLAALETMTSALPSSLREVIGGCLYPEPSTRPTAEQLVDYLDRQALPMPTGDWLPSALTADIEALAAATPSSATGSGAVGGGLGLGGGLGRRKLLLGLTGGALAAGGVAAAVVFSSRRPAPKREDRAGAAAPPARSASPSGASPAPSPTGGPTQIPLDGPDATKAWTATGSSAPTAVEASGKVVMVVTEKSTAFLNASTGKRALPALNTTDMLGSDARRSPTAYADGVFYYLGDAPKAPNMVVAVDETTGHVKWATSMALFGSGGGAHTRMYSASSVAVHGRTVYVCGEVNTGSSSITSRPTGYIRAFDGATGKGLWRVEGKDIDNVLVPPSGSYLLAASSATKGKPGRVQMIDAGRRGARGWKRSIPNAQYLTQPGWPMTCYAAGMFVFAGGTGDTLFAVEAATGSVKWHQHFDSKSGDHIQLGTPFASPDGETVYVPVGSDLAALRSTDGSLRWVATLTGAGDDGTSNMFKASLQMSGMSARCTVDTVFATDVAKNLWAIDAATGRARWKYNDPGQPDVGFKWTVGGDRVFIASHRTLTAISAHGQ
ncbi:outer membrane protein assembly factor BamB family protein [Streptomyces beihaiensis]|uniref:PQQ-binding-like beta-propeller repeat protein n=1 Tax=Streptomyces beihaiensis TaxID=2984495 RepID=A0ABT3TZQ8_9ACTN|nr:PQQ-binding-like beta-propeller repeat protein [Streptomyces beihaiensis]MCX3061936.1 PQQ-binding-like beta-propeller repeat protein [Streptomyces beihaiensis]